MPDDRTDREAMEKAWAAIKPWICRAQRSKRDIFEAGYRAALASLAGQTEQLRDALVFARSELHRALLERGSTVGYRQSFDRINAALAASPVPRVVPQQGEPDEAEALCMFCGTRGELPSGDCALCTVRELTAALSMALVELEPEGGTDPWRNKVILKARDALAARSGEGTGPK